MKKCALICAFVLLVTVLSGCAATVGKGLGEASSQAVSGTESTASSENVSSEAHSSQTHRHTFADATCTAPKTCSCGATEGEPAGHQFAEATCKDPMICKVCKVTEGDSLSHKYGSDNKCTRCGEIDPASYTLLMKESYATYEAWVIDDKEGMLVCYSLKYHGKEDVVYTITQYEEVSKAESEKEFEGKYFKLWYNQVFDNLKNIQVAENLLTFSSEIEGAPIDLTLSVQYRNGAFWLKDDYDEYSIMLVRN